MAEIQLPWFYALDHLPNVTTLVGEGAFNVATGSNTTLVDGFRTLYFGAPYVERSIPPTAEIAVGCRGKSNVTGTSVAFFAAGGVSVLEVFNNGGVLELRKGTTVLGSSGQNVLTMRYIECLVRLVGPGLDSCTLRVDGQEALALTGLSLGASAIHAMRYHGTLYQTHWYIRDAAGLESPFYGPILPRWLPAATDVGTQQWTRNGGTSNAGRVRDYPGGTDGAATYVETQTLGARDEYKVDLLPEGLNSIIAVVPFAVATAPSGGAPQHRLGVKTSGGETVGPARTVGISGYQTQVGHAVTQKPGGGGWSRTAVNEISLTLEAA